MRMDVTFSQTEMAFSPAFDTTVSIPGGGDPEALNAHIADNNNPHGVTCEQIGAATQTALAALNQYAMEEIERLDMDNAGHVFDEENPHKVTCEQIGAVTESAFTEAVGDIGSALDELHSYAQGLVSGGGA